MCAVAGKGDSAQVRATRWGKQTDDTRQRHVGKLSRGRGSRSQITVLGHVTYGATDLLHGVGGRNVAEADGSKDSDDEVARENVLLHHTGVHSRQYECSKIVLLHPTGVHVKSVPVCTVQHVPSVLV
eukprot:1207130-Rhodomonas_salina.2